MAIRMIEKKFDDLDGSDLPDDTRAWKFQVQGKTYDLYLSKENRAKVEKFIGDLTKGAIESGTSKTPKKTAASRTDLTDVRAWLREQGHSVGPTGKISKAMLEEYDAAH
jgi:hypothetical protein